VLKRKVWVWVLLGVVLLIGTGVVAWSRQQQRAAPEALAALESDAEVTARRSMAGL
jgi:hypothetical protein